jgi:aquaporin Z
MTTNPVSRYLAELIGTCILVLIGCGTAVLAGGDVGFVGVSLAFGSALLVLVYCLGPISGCHLNPAVTLCLALTRKFPAGNVLGYIASQCLGAILGGFIIYMIATGKAGFDVQQGFALNGFGEYSPKGYTMMACLITEVVMTALLLFVILSTTHASFSTGFAGIAIGFTLTAIHLMSIPVTNTSVNFARSLGVAIFHGGWALEQLWLFAVAQVIAVFLAMGMHCISCCKN